MDTSHGLLRPCGATVNGATYRTAREALGLSIKGAAKFHGVAERSVRYWETDGTDIPAGIPPELSALSLAMNRASEMMCDDWRNLDFPSPFVLLRYNDPVAYFKSPLSEIAPFEAHGILVHRISLALERAGATVEIRYGDTPNP